MSLPTTLPTHSLHVTNLHCSSCADAIRALTANLPVCNLLFDYDRHRITFAVDEGAPGSSSGTSVARVVDDVKRALASGGFIVADAEPAKPASVRGWFGRRARKSTKQHVEMCPACREGADEMEGLDGASPHTPAGPVPVPPPTDTDQVVVTTLLIEGMTCASCTGSITGALEANPAVLGVDINLLASSGVVRHRGSLTPAAIVELVEDSGFDAEVVESHPESTPGDQVLVSTFSIEGMTCASCTGSISGGLETNPAILGVDVNLLASSGTVRHRATLSPQDVADLIDDMGFEAEVVESHPESTPTNIVSSSAQRTINVHVTGTTPEVVPQLNAALAAMPLEAYSPLALPAATTTITYAPRTLGVRDILARLAAVAPDLAAEIVHPPSVADRSRAMMRKEVRLLAVRLGIAFVFAIPTFIIAIVSMVLLRMSHPFRRFWDEPVWGGANRGTVVMWPLATVVQFGVGSVFYSRALGPMAMAVCPAWLLALCGVKARKRSANATKHKLTWRSFFSFGSMDLLVVLSTTVSYFASVAMMILDVRAGPGQMSIGSYFDSSVFLIMFILLGRTLEAYAKSRTTDAVALLGGLRPATAWLVQDESKVDLTPVDVDDKEATAKVPKLPPTQEEEGDTPPPTGAPREIPIDHVESGDLLLIPAGSLPPTDGVIVWGRTTFDESSLTGESRPVAKAPGDDVFTGTTNTAGAVVVRVTSVGGDTLLSRLIRAVSDASGRKAPIERAAERLTAVFVPIVIYFALIILALWLALVYTGHIPAHKFDDRGRAFFAIEFAIATLVVACPCGIGLAVPCANAVGNGLAAAQGILAAGGGEAFTAATKVGTIAFDKTGTLTQGTSVVTDADDEHTTYGMSAPTLRAAVRAVEEQSTHPLAAGLVTHLAHAEAAAPAINNAAASSLSLAAASSLSLATRAPAPSVQVVGSTEIPGRGLRATVAITAATDAEPALIQLLIGNAALLADHGAPLAPAAAATVAQWSNDAKSVILVAARPQPADAEPAPDSSPVDFSKPQQPEAHPFALCAMYALSDPPRPETPEVVAALHARGYRVVMLSGDNAATAAAVARRVGIAAGDVRAGVGPEGKADAIAAMQEDPAGEAAEHGAKLEHKEAPPRRGLLGRLRRRRAPAREVMFVGDGVNDTPALASASASVAMGHGAQATLASAAFVLLRSDLRGVLALLDLSRRVRNRQYLNLLWACIFNVVCLPIAAGVLFPAGIRLSPVWSAILMACSSVSVVLSSLALRWGL